jgi:hypothetical protein
MWSTIFTAASSVLGSRMAGGNQPTATMTAADVGQVGGAVQYNQLLSAWDSYLNNEYLEMSKRIIT